MAFCARVRLWEFRDFEIFGVLDMFLVEDGTPFRHGDDMVELIKTRDTGGLVVLTLRQREELLVLRPVRRNLIPRARTRVGLEEREPRLERLPLHERRHA